MMELILMMTRGNWWIFIIILAILIFLYFVLDAWLDVPRNDVPTEEERDDEDENTV